MAQEMNAPSYSEQEQIRRDKLAALRACGQDPYLLTKATTYYHKAAGVQFMISYSGSYTNDILSGKWTSIHKKL